MYYSKEDIMTMVSDNGVKFIRLQFTDVMGTLKNIAITERQLEKALDNKCMFDGSSINGFVRIEESDMYLRPDLDTFTIFPWRPQQGKVARMICDVYRPDGTPFEGDPRYILKNAIKEANKLGYSMNVGPECEFFLFEVDSKGNPTLNTNDKGGYFDLGPIDLGENARRDISLALEDMGFEIEASHHEVAPGQNEIDFKYNDALITADNMTTFKYVVKAIAQRHGLYATFMPKPIHGIDGSGMHINISLMKKGKNAFCNEEDKLGLSDTAYKFIAGILKHIKGMSAITNPLVNSYKRLVPNYEAPVHIAWSAKNRSPLVRVPAAGGENTRIEVRCPDPSANPYLLLAVLLAAGIDGIKNNLELADCIDRNIFEMTESEKNDLGLERLPESLKEAIEHMKESKLVKETLGEHTYSSYLKTKELEWEEYRTQVHAWEIENYLTKY